MGKDLPPGVYPYHKKYRAVFAGKYCGIHDTPKEAVEAIKNYKKEHNLPDRKPGRPKLNQDEPEKRTPHSFCETPDEKCTMSYCDENGCLNRKRITDDPADIAEPKSN